MKPGAPPLPQVNESELEILKEAMKDLRDAWNKYCIPDNHRELFISCIRAVPKSKTI